jgi:pimeloyl-ACP methyl ester carboxylesterase
MLFTYQRSLIYYPQPSFIDTPASTLKMPIADGNLQISVRQLNSSKALIYFGGNAEDVSLNLPDFSAAFPDYAIYLLHYRGYGHSSGAPSEQAIQQDAVSLFDKVHAEHPDITLIGRSLGSGVAVRLASLRPLSKLVLITPYNSLEEVAAFHFPYFPISQLLLDKYESWRYAPQITVPTLILTAEHDEIIPRANTEKLYSQFKSGIVSYQILADTDHNTISQSSQYLPLLKEFMKKPVRQQPI